MNDERYEAAQKLLNAAHEFFNSEHRHGNRHGTVFVTGAQGEVVIFTRGEQREALMDALWSIGKGSEHVFGEHMTDNARHLEGDDE